MEVDGIHVAIIAFAAVTLVLAVLGSFASNATLAAIVRLVYYGLTAAALLVLRRRRGPPPGFRLPAAGLIAPLAMLFCVYLISTRTLEQAWLLVSLVVAGAVFHAAAGRRRGGAGRAAPGG